jgi:hypothetical protein
MLYHKLVGHLVERSQAQPARVRDHPVQAAEAVDDGPAGGVQLRRVPHIGRHGDGPPAVSFDALHGDPPVVRVVLEGADADRGAHPGCRDRHRAADPAARPRHQYGPRLPHAITSPELGPSVCPV